MQILERNMIVSIDFAFGVYLYVVKVSFDKHWYTKMGKNLIYVEIDIFLILFANIELHFSIDMQ